MIIPADDSTTLSLLYHLNSEPWQNLEAYQGDGYGVDYKSMGGRPSAVGLPAPQDTHVMRLLGARESCRQFRPSVMSQTTLSTLLAGGYGLTRLRQAPEGIQMLFRTVPSAGALYPLELYVVAENVEALPDGLHHYNVRDHSLELVKTKGEAADLHGALLTAPFVRHANLVIYLAAVFMRTQKKYGPRGYRYILLEAGHVVQNICLLAAEQGLGSLCMGGFIDSKLNRLLGLDGNHEAVVYSVAVGHVA